LPSNSSHAEPRPVEGCYAASSSSDSRTSPHTTISASAGVKDRREIVSDHPRRDAGDTLRQYSGTGDVSGQRWSTVSATPHTLSLHAAAAGTCDSIATALDCSRRPQIEIRDSATDRLQDWVVRYAAGLGRKRRLIGQPALDRAPSAAAAAAVGIY